MKKIIGAFAALFSAVAFGATLTPVQLLNPTGSSAGQAIVSTGSSSAPGWGNVPVANVTGAAPLASPVLTGTPTAPTATGGTNTTQIATTAFVANAISGVTAGGAPYFKATMSTNQTLTAGTAAKITFNTKAEDSNSAYDATTNFRFTPQRAGLYWVNVTLSMSSTVTAQGNYTYAAWIFKNGSQYSGWGATGYAGAGANTSATPMVGTLVRMNGTTDYIEAWGEIFSGQTSPTVNGGTTASFFSAYFVGP
jgi:hypothetical protein